MKWKSSSKLATGGITIPGHPHCGPFNAIGEDTTGPLDEACKEHDKQYQELGNKAYWKFNSADSNLLRDSANIPGISSSIVRGVFKAKKAILPHMPPAKKARTEKNWPQIQNYNRTRPSGTAATTTTTTDIPRDSPVESPMNEAMEDLSINSQLLMETGEPAAKRARLAETNSSGIGGSGGRSATVPVPRMHPVQPTVQVKCKTKGVLWFYTKAVTDAKGTFKPWKTWVDGNNYESVSLPGAGAKMIVHSEVIHRQMSALHSKGTSQGRRWRVYGPNGLTTGTELSQVKLLAPKYTMMKFSNWNMYLWPAAALNNDNDSARNMPIMLLDVATEKTGFNHRLAFDFGYQSTNSADIPEFPMEEYQDCTRYQMGESFTKIPLKFLQSDTHTICNDATHSTNKTIAQYYETPWWEASTCQAPSCQAITTQLHVYDQSIKKELRAAQYTTATTGYTDKTDNFICIPYTMECDIIFANPF